MKLAANSSDGQTRFLNNSVSYAMSDQLLVKYEGLRRDIAQIFSLPSFARNVSSLELILFGPARRKVSANGFDSRNSSRVSCKAFIRGGAFRIGGGRGHFIAFRR